MLKKYLKEHFFFYTLLILLFLAIAASFYRFVVISDYTIYDEIECDPYTSSCFLYCETDECEEPFYYAEMTRNAAFYINVCEGLDYYDCDASYDCMPEEKDCTVTFCDETDPENDCYHFTNIEDSFE